ncbi:MAG: glycosyltransferase [Fidelibacterota bacterium]
MTNFSVIFHLPEDQTPEVYQRTYQSILDEFGEECEVLALQCGNEELLRSPKVTTLQVDNLSYPQQMNLALKQCSGDWIIYLNNRSQPIFLKSGFRNLMEQALLRHPNAGMIYSDYELVDQGVVKEIQLLNHHAGRLRDNQDYGYVFLWNRQLISDLGYFDEYLEYNSLYDTRLKLSEKGAIVHIANNMQGSLYTVMAKKQEADVFDYLKAGKDIQQEAERVLTDHLRRMGAYLPPGKYYQERPQPSTPPPLKASVIIPVYFRPEFIGTAIESVQAQTEPEIEVIVVVNGGQADPTVQEVKRYLTTGDRYRPDKPAVRLLVTDINNIGFCLNLGVRHAQGEYYVQLDSDDRLKPQAVAMILQTFASDPTMGMVIGSYEVWEKKSSGDIVRMEAIPVVTHDEWTEDNGRNNLLRINGAGAPRAIPIQLIKEMGYFSINDEPFARNYGEDYDLVLRISEHYRIGRIYEPIYEVIRHAGGTDHSIDQATTDRNDEAKDWMRKQALLRRQRLNKSQVARN